MKSTHYLILIATVLLLTGCFNLTQNNQSSDLSQPTINPIVTDTSPTLPPNTGPGADPFNTTYIINNQQYTLQNGKATVDNNTVTLWGQPTYGPLSDQGNQDAAIILVLTSNNQSTYFVAAGLEYLQTYSGSNALPLGQQITITNLEISNQTIMVQYTEADTQQLATFFVTEGILEQLPSSTPPAN